MDLIFALAIIKEAFRMKQVLLTAILPFATDKHTVIQSVRQSKPETRTSTQSVRPSVKAGNTDGRA